MSNAEIQELRAGTEDVIRLRRNVKHAETRTGGGIAAVGPRRREFGGPDQGSGTDPSWK
ncbi:hypothetical protein [Arthrobacter sp. PsM3]|uniref:hypothetical protein n=1 Tax=Arthrobacter sp. PsM3 TaxID=3030531 RepID=UPI00263A532D|nr:hypothetical protein [Arthrobacter sp. PsM3]MDN4643074.1 hypothetical protein [Arthrobacter sp. PsM3]